MIPMLYIIALMLVFVGVVYIVSKFGGPGCSGNCQQGRHPCDCPLVKKDQNENN
jgi:hypothetical protein